MDTIEKIQRAKEGDKEIREQLITENMGLVWSIVRRFLGRGYEAEDLFQVGSIGLMKAIDKFDITYDVKFSTYAVPMILGEIKRFLRDDGEIKVSRLIKIQALQINRFIESKQRETGKEPTIEEIATALNITKEDVVFAMDSSKMPVSLYETIEDGEDKGQSLIDKIPSKHTEEEQVDKLYLKSLISSLTDREQKIIMLRYFRDKTQGEVAKILGVSQVQVSRLETKILTKLKSKAE